MREAKYRAWYENSQTWVYFEFNKPMSLDAIKVHTQLCIEGKEFYEFTGLKDKNEKEIYEGDIFMNGQSIRIIEIRGGNTHAIKPDKTESILLSFIVNNPKNTVIGNIHENPELLKS